MPTPEELETTASALAAEADELRQLMRPTEVATGPEVLSRAALADSLDAVIEGARIFSRSLADTLDDLVAELQAEARELREIETATASTP